jgi:hypothetical protein
MAATPPPMKRSRLESVVVRREGEKAIHPHSDIVPVNWHIAAHPRKGVALSEADSSEEVSL